MAGASKLSLAAGMSSLVGLFLLRLVGEDPDPEIEVAAGPQEEALESELGGFWRRILNGEHGEQEEEGEVQAEEEDAEGLRCDRVRESASGEEEMIVGMLQKREAGTAPLDGEKTGEFETATEQDIVSDQSMIPLGSLDFFFFFFFFRWKIGTLGFGRSTSVSLSLVLFFFFFCVIG